MNPNRLFVASCIALITTAMCFALRGAAVGAWTTQFNLTNEQVGWVNDTAFWGFTIAMVIGGPLVDVIGLKRILWLAIIGHLAGIILSIFAWNYSSLYIATLLFGIGNGSVEAACNPLIATIYPNDQTTKLNKFHMWFPGGIVIGGLTAFALGKLGLDWKAQFASMLIPLVAYAFMFVGQEVPQTARVQRGESTGSMWKACLAPGFLVMVVCMFMTAASELGPQSWIPNIFDNAGYSGALVLSLITGIMAIGRWFAGPAVHKLSAIGVLIVSAVLSTAGLFAMSKFSGGMLLVAAVIFAVGVCFFWPTMLGYVAENYPKTGALGLAIMGGAGMLSAGKLLPYIGRWYDQGIAARTAGGVASTPAIQAAAGLEALGKVAIFPAILTVIFIIIAVMRKKPAAAAAH